MSTNKVISTGSVSCDPAVVPQARKISSTEEVAITCFENEVPSFIGPELERLYASLYASLPFFQVYGDMKNVSTYIARRGNEISSVLLFSLENGKVRVLNEMIGVDEKEIIPFANYIFENFPSARQIVFQAVATRAAKLPLSIQRSYYTDDIVLELPATEEEYVANLGKSTRKNIKHHLSRSKRTFPSFQHQVHVAEDANEEDIRTIVEFNKLRMAGKNRISSLDDQETERIIKLVKLCGFISVIKIEGRICAGAIYFRVADHYFTLVNAHDPEYDDFRLGTLCCYLTILECIRRNGRQFHFLWGRYEYKFALLGVCRKLEQISIYRSSLHVMLDARNVFKKGFASRAQLVKFWLLEERRKNNFRGKTLARLLRHMRH